MIEYYGNRCDSDKCEKCTYSSCSNILPSLVLDERIIKDECTECYDKGSKINFYYFKLIKVNVFDSISAARISIEINET